MGRKRADGTLEGGNVRQLQRLSAQLLQEEKSKHINPHTNSSSCSICILALAFFTARFSLFMPVKMPFFLYI